MLTPEASLKNICNTPEKTMNVYDKFIIRCASDDDSHRDNGLKEILAPDELKLKPPPLYRVVLLNDDYTPMEFVVAILQKFFKMDVETATRVMLKVHTEGKGVCGVFPREIAETKAVQVNDYAREAEHPLLCDIEVDD